MVESNQMYSNFGPLHDLFSKRLSDYFLLQPSQIELFSNGTMALVAALHSLKIAQRPYCLLPSWTFSASAQAVVAAGLIPIFVDVDETTMQLNAEILHSVSEEILKKTSVVLIVSPFGAPLNLSGFKELSEHFGMKVLCDCAAGFDAVQQIQFPTVISMHATKSFGIGEGGALLGLDEELIANARAYSNFGFMGGRESRTLGVNGKLSEFHAAIGLAALDLWAETRSGYFVQATQYLNNKTDSDTFQFQNGWGSNWISSSCVIRFSDENLKRHKKSQLLTQNISTRDWWESGCHLQPAFKSYKSMGSLSNTLKLASVTLGIPFYRGIDFCSVDKIFQILNDV
ncbi:DegT/DnrJ/EryC1/StrS family aminotransferase [Polynucleobacter cosmopolitanus]|nr:DegT/DnrJ/EryC1/StrS family aminotransferase [Polynucleobacter cosmopolitanus]